jgi:hypothetical protein
MNVTAVDWRFRVWRMELRNSLMTYPSPERSYIKDGKLKKHMFDIIISCLWAQLQSPIVLHHLLEFIKISSIVTKSIIGLEALLWTKPHHKRLSQSSAFSCDGIQVRFWVTYVQICGCMMQIGTEVWKRDTLLLLIYVWNSYCMHGSCNLARVLMWRRVAGGWCRQEQQRYQQWRCTHTFEARVHGGCDLVFCWKECLITCGCILIFSLGRIQDGILWVAMCQGPAETPFRYAKSFKRVFLQSI